MTFYHKKHLFFDLDHTLWDFDRNSAAAFDVIFKEHGFDFSTEEFLKHYVPRNQYYWKLYQVNKVSHEDLRYYRLKDVFDVLGVDVSREIIHQLSEDYISHLPNSNHLFDGAIEVLEYLQPHYNLHIITNGFHFVQDKKLRNANIEHFFQTVTNSEMAGEKKPHPIIFEHALSLANADKQESIMIGDSLEADVEGAINFGMDAIFFNAEKIATSQPVYQINHLLELKNIL
ncbi:YjjG family noncanonical pyrimidine nucleotidase [Flavobacterium sp. NRK F10]|uniref:YjjG family noncanonical pyrimidine nucleotidase n=1 Tax=Flavobacterium sp. NRK F10 TaxID=2954931 RepID=UPI0020903EBE|nr:YjjG family noncanonical pyrimidine nucleotidase [Flavobacterium sp. NRK F10]MCO6174299.1 YjjG family noncanonical pyrimidine nucleotidase [Flavobacterium sp. NRK F10]